MSGEKSATSPGYWIFAGIFIIVLGGILQATQGDETQVGVIGLWAGGAMLVFGIVAKAIQLGVRSARDDHR